MPTRARRYCLHKGCSRLLDFGGRCPEHDAQWRGNSSARGYGADWRPIRNQHIAEEPLCRRCDHKGLTIVGALVDHVVPHRLNATLRTSGWNLQTLCTSCHRSKTAGEEDGLADLIYPLPAYGPIPDLRVVTGMPGSGKSTYVRANAQPNDTVLDLDDLGASLFRTGPYRLSRNPIYLAFSLFQLGLALALSSVALLITLIPAVALMAFVVIPREERYLEARFPAEYSSYKAAVRRWL